MAGRSWEEEPERMEIIKNIPKFEHMEEMKPMASKLKRRRRTVAGQALKQAMSNQE